MAEEQRLSEHGTFDFMETKDIGASNGQNAGGDISMQLYRRVMCYIELGTWDSNDDLDTAQLQQATNSSGGSRKDLTSSSSGGNYDTDNPLDADGDFVIIEAKGEDFDVDNLFTHVRLNVAEVTGTGTDNATAVLVRYQYQQRVKELQGTAVTGSKVYVDTNT